jgi:hypothetical protein
MTAVRQVKVIRHLTPEEVKYWTENPPRPPLTPEELKRIASIRVCLKTNQHLIAHYREMFPTEDLTTRSSAELYSQYKTIMIQARKYWKEEKKQMKDDETDTYDSAISYD